MKKKVCLIAQFPPPIHGLSKAVDTLYKSEQFEEFDFEKVDIKDNKKIIRILLAILRSKADLFYFTISQSRGGNLRDLIILKLLEKKKVLIHLHGGYYRQLVDNELPRWQRKANYKAISKLAGVIVLGPSLKYIFEGMLPEELIFTVPNCVDDELLMSDEAIEQKLAALSQCGIKHVLYLSNFLKSKGYRDVLKMAQIEKQRFDQTGQRLFHFDFAGLFFDDVEKDFFFQYVKENQLGNVITFHGTADSEKKKALLRESKFFVLLSDNEGQPISILEAMGSGLVVVTTEVGGIPDVVKDGKNGMVIDHKDPQRAQKAYRYILNFNDDEMGLRNCKEVREKYTEAAHLKNMAAVFNGRL